MHNKIGDSYSEKTEGILEEVKGCDNREVSFLEEVLEAQTLTCFESLIAIYPVGGNHGYC
tara:strand:+ start:1144 stop:1323 length:180 start_codon:yes stop_codon:yes gene_type:complete